MDTQILTYLHRLLRFLQTLTSKFNKEKILGDAFICGTFFTTVLP